MSFEAKHANHFDLPNDTKLAVQNWVREIIIPQIIERGEGAYTSEQELLILHRCATKGVILPSPESELTRTEDLLLDSSLANQYPEKDLKQLAKKILNPNKSTPVTVSLARHDHRGMYRLEGTITHGNNKKPKIETIWQDRGFKIDNGNISWIYPAPLYNVDVLMKQLCQKYDQQKNLINENKLIDTAMNLAFIHTIGKLIMHPFTDGNHRAFDRFLELEFAKIKTKLDIPQDETSNVPRDSIFRSRQASLILNLLNNNDLSKYLNLNIRHNKKEFTIYQEKLSKAVSELIEKGVNSDPHYRFLYAYIAGDILSWTNFNQFDQIGKIIITAQKEGNFDVIHQRRPE